MATSKFSKVRWVSGFVLIFVHRPLHPEDIAKAAVYMLSQPVGVSVKAMDVVPSGKVPFR
jgi:NADP-dependent 3-hydroxy acid dehydrogenase YdfG